MSSSLALISASKLLRADLAASSNQEGRSRSGWAGLPLGVGRAVGERSRGWRVAAAATKRRAK